MDKEHESALFEYLIRRADDHFVLSHRLSEWVGHGPMLEEELALSNIALDLLGQARNLYTFAGEIEDAGRDEDALAFLRKEHEYHNLLLVEKANGDFAQTIARQLFFSVHAQIEWIELANCTDRRLADIANKARKEASYHVRHAAEWFIRLGDGTKISTERTINAVQTLAPLVAEMFDEDEVSRQLAIAKIIPAPSEVRREWDEQIAQFFQEARLDPQLLEAHPIKGARFGRHSEAMGHILSDLQYMQRTYAGCQW